MTTTQQQASTTTASAINARDFSRFVTDNLRDTWTVAKMQAVIEAVGDLPVMIVADKGTGFALVNVRLVRAYYGANGARVTVRSIYSDGSEGGTNYLLSDIGTVVVLGDSALSPGRSAAWHVYFGWETAAVRKAQADHEANHPYGKWEATPIGDRKVSVTYTPQSETGGERGHWTYTV